jgi:hypothetical protein
MGALFKLLQVMGVKQAKLQQGMAQRLVKLLLVLLRMEQDMGPAKLEQLLTVHQDLPMVLSRGLQAILLRSQRLQGMGPPALNKVSPNSDYAAPHRRLDGFLCRMS